MQSILGMKKNWQHSELNMAAAELNFFKGNHMQGNSSISKSTEILIPAVAWHLETLMLTAMLMLRLLVEKRDEAILLITMILTESKLDFLGVQEIKELNLEVHILGDGSMTLVHATTIEFWSKVRLMLGLYCECNLNYMTSMSRHHSIFLLPCF